MWEILQATWSIVLCTASAGYQVYTCYLPKLESSTVFRYGVVLVTFAV